MNDEPRSPAGSEPVEEEPPTSTAEAQPRRRVARAILTEAWPTAVVWSLIPLAAAFLLALLLSLLSSASQPFQLGTPPPGFEELEPSFGNTLVSALFIAFTFHLASFTVEFPSFQAPDAPFPGGFDLSASGSFAPLLGTALVGALLFLAGRAVARRANGPGWERALHGAKIFVPYTILAVLVSLGARQSIELPGGPDSPFGAGGEFSFGISTLSVLVWSALLALLFGALGGAASDRDEVFAGRRATWARGALGGGWRMTWVALALSFVGLLVLAAVHNDGTRAYFELVGELGASGGAYFVLNTILFLPNMAAWVTSGALGGTVLSANLFGSSCGLVSYGRFPSGAADVGDLSGLGPEQFFADPCSVIPIRFETAPLGYFLFLLVPLVAVVLGGMAAARLAQRGTVAERAAMGAGAGVVFAFLVLLLVVFSDLSVSVDVPFLDVFAGGGTFGVGPAALLAFGLALAWGVVGGALGAVLAGRGATEAPPTSATGEPAG